MERRYLLDGEPLTHEMNGHHQEEDPCAPCQTPTERLVPDSQSDSQHLASVHQRRCHRLLASLFYLFISPVLELLSIPVYGLDTVRWGLLDYPALAVFVVPLIFAPLVIRVLANLSELRRQNLFLKRNPKTPKLISSNQVKPTKTSS